MAIGERRDIARVWAWAFALSACLVVSKPSFAQPETIYTYDSSNRLIQATATNGAAVRFQYDLAGNRISSSPVQPQQLTPGVSLTVPSLAAGQAALMSYTSNGNEALTLKFEGISTTPSGVAVTFNVYDQYGFLMATVSGVTGAVVNLPSLAAGIYYVIAIPGSGATAVFSVNPSVNPWGQSSGDSEGGGDAPLPVWAWVVLGILLLAASQGKLPGLRQLRNVR